MTQVLTELLCQLEQKWDSLDERAQRAHSFNDIEDFRLNRAKQGAISMCAMLIFKQAKKQDIEISDGLRRKFIEKISTKTNIRV